MRNSLLPRLTVALPTRLGVALGPAGVAETVVRAADFGMTGDGVTDDGPALQAAVQALTAAAPP